jgi:type II secretory pathway pseudopilin PulG
MLKLAKINERGMSLIEVIIAMGIMILFSFVIPEIFLSSFRSQKIVFDQLEAQRQGRRTLQDFVNELRASSYSSIGAYPIEVASTTEIVFYSNLDNNGYIEKIRYYRNGRNLIKGVTAPTGTPLAYLPQDEVTSTVVDIINNTTSIFYYYDKNISSSSTPLSYPIDITSIRFVKMSLRIDKNPTTSPVALMVEGSASIRNLNDK